MENLNLLQQFLVCVAVICASFALALALGRGIGKGIDDKFPDDMAQGEAIMDLFAFKAFALFLAIAVCYWLAMGIIEGWDF